MPTLNQFIIEAAIILRRGPRLEAGEASVTLCDDPDFTVTYERHDVQIRETVRVTGALGDRDERIDPAGLLRLKVTQQWSVVTQQDDYDLKCVRLNPDQARSRDARVARAVQAAMVALEVCTDSHVDQKISPVYGSAEIEQHAVTLISPSNAASYTRYLRSFASENKDSVLAAYSVARLRREHLAPAIRVVFTWALLERITRLIKRGRDLSHHDIEREVLSICDAAIAQETVPVVEGAKVRKAVKKAYELRNGLAHGQPKSSIKVDFPALGRAVTLMLRRLASTRP